MTDSFVYIKIVNVKTRCLVDTGASLSVINESLFKKIPAKIQISPSRILQIKGVGGQCYNTKGCVVLPVLIGNLIIHQEFHIFENSQHPVILGRDFLKKHNANIDWASRTLTVHKGLTGISLLEAHDSCIVKPSQNIKIPANCQCIIEVKVPKHCNTQNVLLQPSATLTQRLQLLGAKCLVNIVNGKSVYKFLNPNDFPIFIHKNSVIATAHKIDVDSIQPLNDDTKDRDNSKMTSETQEEINNIDSVKNTVPKSKLNIDLSQSDLTNDQKQQLTSFLNQNKDIFATSLDTLGRTDLYQHKIETNDAPPQSRGMYRQGPILKAETDKQVEELLKVGMIEPSDSEWYSPVVMIKKKSGDYRFAIDYRPLNKVTKPISFPLPRLEDVFDTLGESKAQVFSVLDLASGYWQIPLHPETKHKTAFITHQGIFEWNRLPFGLRNAPASFQKLMTKVMQGLHWKSVLVYVDDFLIFSKTFNEHLQHLSEVFDRLRNAKLTLKPSKCQFAVNRVLYLGHILSKHGVEVDKSKTDAITTFPIPKNVHNIRSFLGICNYYRRFIKDFAKIASPLTNLLRKDVNFLWSENCNHAFEKLKQALTSAPVLAFPDMNKEFILTSDASGTAIGYILSQKDKDGAEHPISFGGRSLKDGERKFHITELECLAMLEGIKAFHPYLANRHFTAITDHSALKWLQSIKMSTGRLARWAVLFQGYTFTVLHRPGKKNQNADTLSRREYPVTSAIKDHEILDQGEVLSTCQQHTNDAEYPNKQEWVQTHFWYPNEEKSIEELNSIQIATSQDLKSLQEKCQDCKPIIDFLSHNILPTDRKTAQRIQQTAKTYFINDEILYHSPYSTATSKLQKSPQIALPKSLRTDAIRSYHDSLAGGGHLGFIKTYKSLLTKYYWPKMYKEIKEYTRECQVCQTVKRNFNAKKAPLTPMPIESKFHRWHMDILGPITPSEEGHKYILVVVESFSNWCEAFPLKSQEATEIAEVLFREIFSRYGAPRTLISDRGKNFMSKLVAALCAIFQVTRHHTSSYHPQMNSTVERVNPTLAQSLRAYIDDKQVNWPKSLPGILMAIRRAPCTESTLHSPFYLLFGCEMNLPFDTAIMPKATLAKTTQQILNEYIERLHQSNKVAAQNKEKAQKRYKEIYDRKTRVPQFKIGDKVLLHVEKPPKGLCPKLYKKWIGPFRILDAKPTCVYRLQNCQTGQIHSSLVHANRLKSFVEKTDDQLTEQDIQIQNESETSPQPSSKQMQITQPEISDENIEQENDCSQAVRDPLKVIASKRQDGRLYYKVKWKDLPNTTWEFSETIPEAMIKNFHINHNMAGKARKIPLSSSKHKFFTSK